MNRKSFLRLLGSLPLLGLTPIRNVLPPMGDDDLSILPNINNLSPEQLDAFQKIRYFEAQLEKQKGSFSWYLHNELRHHWGAFSEAKSMEHANIILEHSIMDAYIMNTLSDWYFAPENPPVQPDLAVVSLQRRAESYSELSYVRVACLLRAGEINSIIGNRTLAQDHFTFVIDLCKKYKDQTSQLALYQYKAQLKMLE